MKFATLIAAGLLSSNVALAQDATQVIQINEGWNFISINVIPEEADLVDVLADHVENVWAVKDDLAQVYLPQYNFNGIGEIQAGEGYQVVATSSFELVITGEQANANDDYFLTTGWSTIGSTLTHDIPADCFAQFVASHTEGFESVQLKDNYGNNVWLGTFGEFYADAIAFPSTSMTFYGFNEIEVGEGYQVRLDAADGLTFSWAQVAKTCKTTDSSTGSREAKVGRR